MNISTHGDGRKIQFVAPERKALEKTMEVFQTLIIVDSDNQEHYRLMVQGCEAALRIFGAKQ